MKFQDVNISGGGGNLHFSPPAKTNFSLFLCANVHLIFKDKVTSSNGCGILGPLLYVLHYTIMLPFSIVELLKTHTLLKMPGDKSNFKYNAYAGSLIIYILNQLLDGVYRR